MSSAEQDLNQQAEAVLAELLVYETDYSEIVNIQPPITNYTPYEDTIKQISECGRDVMIVIVGALRMGKTTLARAMQETGYYRQDMQMKTNRDTSGILPEVARVANVKRVQSSRKIKGLWIEEVEARDVHQLIGVQKESKKHMVLSTWTEEAEKIEKSLEEEGVPYKIVELKPLSNEAIIEYLSSILDPNRYQVLINVITKLSGGSLYIANSILDQIKSTYGPITTQSVIAQVRELAHSGIKEFLNQWSAERAKKWEIQTFSARSIIGVC